MNNFEEYIKNDVSEYQKAQEELREKAKEYIDKIQYLKNAKQQLNENGLKFEEALDNIYYYTRDDEFFNIQSECNNLSQYSASFRKFSDEFLSRAPDYKEFVDKMNKAAQEYVNSSTTHQEALERYNEVLEVFSHMDVELLDKNEETISNMSYAYSLGSFTDKQFLDVENENNSLHISSSQYIEGGKYYDDAFSIGVKLEETKFKLTLNQGIMTNDAYNDHYNIFEDEEGNIRQGDEIIHSVYDDDDKEFVPPPPDYACAFSVDDIQVQYEMSKVEFGAESTVTITYEGPDAKQKLLELLNDKNAVMDEVQQMITTLTETKLSSDLINLIDTLPKDEVEKIINKYMPEKQEYENLKERFNEQQSFSTKSDRDIFERDE